VSFLREVVKSTEQKIAERRVQYPLRELRAAVPDRAYRGAFREALSTPEISIIAEFKRSSPSKGSLAPDTALVGHYVSEYEQGRASALSILTEERFFSGSLDDLREARARTNLPILRKDFVIDEYQIYEAAEVGVDAVLLIAAVLDGDSRLPEFLALTRSLGLDALLEVRNEPELERALGLGADLIGINNRNLEAPLEVDTARTVQLLDGIPSTVTIVAESGLKSREELEKLEAKGVSAALIGSAFMEADDRTAMCLSLAGASGGPASLTRQQHAFAS
jgi:indole-3-glycerol phosphate synthase